MHPCLAKRVVVFLYCFMNSLDFFAFFRVRNLMPGGDILNACRRSFNAYGFEATPNTRRTFCWIKLLEHGKNGFSLVQLFLFHWQPPFIFQRTKLILSIHTMSKRSNVFKTPYLLM